MKLVKLIAAALVVSGAGVGAAHADGWSVSALPGEYSQDECMTRARIVLERYERLYGLGEIVETTWTLSGYDSADNVNSLFICRTEGGAVPTHLVSHNVGSDSALREQAQQRLRDLWSSPK